VPELVTGEPPTVSHEGADRPTLDTVPLPPEGIAQVPSPRQKVEAEAPCPPFRLLTGRLPATSVPRFTG
jgi:hypothetical protein